MLVYFNALESLYDSSYLGIYYKLSGTKYYQELRLCQGKHSCTENFAYNLPRFSFINSDILAKLPIKKQDFSLKVALIQGIQPI